MQPKTPYTIDQIDEAIRAIVGNNGVDRTSASWARPHAMLSAAGQSWINQRPEDHHSAILRSAPLDLNKTGCLHPHDGVWPE